MGRGDSKQTVLDLDDVVRFDVGAAADAHARAIADRRRRLVELLEGGVVLGELIREPLLGQALADGEPAVELAALLDALVARIDLSPDRTLRGQTESLFQACGLFSRKHPLSVRLAPQFKVVHLRERAIDGWTLCGVSLTDQRRISFDFGNVIGDLIGGEEPESLCKHCLTAFGKLPDDSPLRLVPADEWRAVAPERLQELQVKTREELRSGLLATYADDDRFETLSEGIERTLRQTRAQWAAAAFLALPPSERFERLYSLQGVFGYQRSDHTVQVAEREIGLLRQALADAYGDWDSLRWPAEERLVKSFAVSSLGMNDPARRMEIAALVMADHFPKAARLFVTSPVEHPPSMVHASLTQMMINLMSI